jgi:hypothetical protein
VAAMRRRRSMVVEGLQFHKLERSSENFRRGQLRCGLFQCQQPPTVPADFREDEAIHEAVSTPVFPSRFASNPLNSPQ